MLLGAVLKTKDVGAGGQGFVVFKSLVNCIAAFLASGYPPTQRCSARGGGGGCLGRVCD